MSARIARGAPTSARMRSSARGKQVRKKSPGLLDSLPLAPDTIRRFTLWILGVLMFALAAAVAIALQLPQQIGNAIGQGAGSAGFEVRRVEIKGLNRMARLPVYAVALDQESMAMPLVDLEGTRKRLLRFGWVREARVSRRLPDTLVVDIVERQPAAIWQTNQRLTLIDQDGVVLDQVKLEAMPDLPLVIGPAANRHASELNALLEAAPQLKPMMGGATWIGGRRWDFRFQSGEILALPEGNAAARKALVHFARMDKATQLLGRGMVRFDMRIPGKLIVRVSNEPGSTISDLAPPAPAEGSAPLDPATTI